MGERITDKLRGREVLNTDKAVQAARESLNLNVFDRVGPALSGPFTTTLKGKIIWPILVAVFVVIFLLGKK